MCRWFLSLIIFADFTHAQTLDCETYTSLQGEHSIEVCTGDSGEKKFSWTANGASPVPLKILVDGGDNFELTVEGSNEAGRFNLGLNFHQSFATYRMLLADLDFANSFDNAPVICMANAQAFLIVNDSKTPSFEGYCLLPVSPGKLIP